MVQKDSCLFVTSSFSSQNFSQHLAIICYPFCFEALYPQVRILHASIRVSSLAFFKDQEHPLIRLAYMCQFNILPGLFLDTKFRNVAKALQNRLSFDYPSAFQPTRRVHIVKLFNVRERNDQIEFVS